MVENWDDLNLVTIYYEEFIEMGLKNLLLYNVCLYYLLLKKIL